MIEQGDLITLDFGCVYQGYVSDITRTFAIGDPGQELKDIYQIVLDAQLHVLAAAQVGVTGAQLMPSLGTLLRKLDMVKLSDILLDMVLAWTFTKDQILAVPMKKP